jgi:hypothetical protein
MQAIHVLADRTDGKVAQALIGDSDQDAMQVHHTIVRKIVEPGAKCVSVGDGVGRRRVLNWYHQLTPCVARAVVENTPTGACSRLTRSDTPICATTKLNVGVGMWGYTMKRYHQTSPMPGVQSGLSACHGCRVGATNGLVSTAWLFFVRHLSSLSSAARL